MSTAPLVVILVLWAYLTYHGVAVKTAWLCLNLLESLRALRSVRQNGRRIGSSTRSLAMRGSLRNWVVYVAVQYAGSLPDTLFGWMPMYAPVRGVVVAGFLLTRTASSASIFDCAITPLVQRYETPIDLTLMFIHAIALLLWHHLVILPFDLVRDKVVWAYDSIRLYSSSSGHVQLEIPRTVVDKPIRPTTPFSICSPTIAIESSTPPSLRLPTIEPATPVQKAKLVAPKAPFTVRRSPRSHRPAAPKETQTHQAAPKRRDPAVRAANIPSAPSIRSNSSKAKESTSLGAGSRPAQQPLTQAKRRQPAVTLGGSIEKHSVTPGPTVQPPKPRILRKTPATATSMQSRSRADPGRAAVDAKMGSAAGRSRAQRMAEPSVGEKRRTVHVERDVGVAQAAKKRRRVEQ